MYFTLKVQIKIKFRCKEFVKNGSVTENIITIYNPYNNKTYYYNFVKKMWCIHIKSDLNFFRKNICSGCFSNIMELSFYHKLKLSSPFIFVIKCCRPLIFQTMNYVVSNNNKLFLHHQFAKLQELKHSRFVEKTFLYKRPFSKLKEDTVKIIYTFYITT